MTVDRYIAGLEAHHDLTSVTRIARYRSVELRVGCPIEPGSAQDRVPSERVDCLVARTRQAMLDL